MSEHDTPWSPGTPCWVDYGAPDVDAARRFYADVLGWTYSGGEPEYGGYLMCEVRGLPAAGLAPQQDSSQPPAWVQYVATQDVDASAEAVTGAGGRVLVAPMDVGPTGRMAIAADPFGAVFGLWQSGEHTGMRIANEPGALIWTDVVVPDLEAARAFYGAVAGWSFEPLPEDDRYVMVASDHGPMGGLDATGDAAGPPRWVSYFCVADTDAAAAAVVAGGGRVLAEPVDTPYGRMAEVADPAGASFRLMSATAAS